MTSGAAVEAEGPRAGRLRAVDVGRLAFVPLVTVLLGVNVYGTTALLAALRDDEPGAAGRLVVHVLTLAFYLLMIVLYLQRGSAKATTSSVPAKLAALAGCWLPLGVPLLNDPTDDPRLLVLANAVLVVGLAGSVWSLRTLGRSFSVVPQARTLVTSGPYGVVRHPLYSFELVALLGLVLAGPTLAAAAAWAAVLAVQLYRSVHEERVLETALPEYAAYRRVSYRLVPGVL